MRLAIYHHRGVTRHGLVTGGTVQPIAVGDLWALLLGEETAQPDGDPVPLADVELRAPLQPATFRDFMTFEQHVEGTSRAMHDGGQPPEEWYQAPAFYFSSPYSVVGPFDDVPVPPGCRVFDFEFEVAAVVGKAGRDLTPEQAGSHIVGYAILNDWSARDIQRREMAVKLGPVKGKDSATTIGPCLVTPDELAEFRRDGFLDLEMEVAVNGVVLGRDSLRNMAWTFEEMVAYASRGAWVMPGDVLGSGTCGTGSLVELWGRYGQQAHPPLRPGDRVAMTATGLGSISNRIVAGTEPVPIPPARRQNYQVYQPELPGIADRRSQPAAQ